MDDDMATKMCVDSSKARFAFAGHIGMIKVCSSLEKQPDISI